LNTYIQYQISVMSKNGTERNKTVTGRFFGEILDDGTVSGTIYTMDWERVSDIYRPLDLCRLSDDLNSFK